MRFTCEASAGSKGALISCRRHPPLRAEVAGHGQRIAAVRPPVQGAGVVRPIQVREVHGGRNVTRRPLGGTGGTVSSPRGFLPPAQELRGEGRALPPGKRPARAANHPAQRNKPTHSSQSRSLLFGVCVIQTLKNCLLKNCSSNENSLFLSEIPPFSEAEASATARAKPSIGNIKSGSIKNESIKKALCPALCMSDGRDFFVMCSREFCFQAAASHISIQANTHAQYLRRIKKKSRGKCVLLRAKATCNEPSHP